MLFFFLWQSRPMMELEIKISIPDDYKNSQRGSTKTRPTIGKKKPPLQLGPRRRHRARYRWTREANPMNCTNHPVDVRKMSLIAGGGLLLRDTSALGSSMGWAGVLPTSTRRQGFLAGLAANIDAKRQCLPVLLPGTLHPRRVREGSLQPRLLFFYGVLGGEKRHHEL